MVLAAMIVIAGPPEQSLDRAAVEAAKLRQVLEVQRCRQLAPCPKPSPCADCPPCIAPVPCMECPQPVVAKKTLPTWVPVVVAAAGALALGVIAGGVL